MARHASHLVRDFAVVGAGILAIALAGLILVGYGFALAIALIGGLALVAFIPVVAIYYEERDLPRDGRPRHV